MSCKEHAKRTAKKIKIIKGDETLLYDKHIGVYDFSIYSVIIGAIIGVMMRDKIDEWSFYYYLIFYAIFLINQQTGLFFYCIKKLKFLFIKKWKNDQNLEWTINERSLSQKLIAGRQLTSLFTIYVLFILYFVTGQWMNIHRYNPSCRLSISVEILQSMNPKKILIFVGTSTIIEFMCCLYHKSTGYKNIIYHKRKNNIFLEGLALYYRLVLMEMTIYGILMANN